jgi:hypothetical protein
MRRLRTGDARPLTLRSAACPFFGKYATTIIADSQMERPPAYIIRQQRDAKRQNKLVKRQARRVEKRQIKSERRGRR